MKRRAAIRIVSLGALAPAGLDSLAKGLATGYARTPEEYKLRFFTPTENEFVDRLMEMIISADSHSPGSHAARVSLFADLMVATSDAAVKERWRKGIALMREEVNRTSLPDALAHYCPVISRTDSISCTKWPNRRNRLFAKKPVKSAFSRKV